ncbi:MAG TPA: hypothetical protein VK563_11465 [Puia sp.]|nr:hypothetical protein [Puia sp.]
MKSPFIQSFSRIRPRVRKFAPLAKYVLIFIIGFMIALLHQFNQRDSAEKNFFKEIASEISEKRPVPAEDSSILDALHITNHLLRYRTEIFHKNDGPVRIGGGGYDGSLTGDLMTANGACGSYADVLAELLETMGFRTRIAQMKVGNTWGGHIIDEVQTSKGWVVLDASNDLFFTTPSGRLASFSDVSSNWEYYKTQTPGDYNQDYRYADVRYTNWEKIPVVMPLLKKALTLFVGSQRVNTISIRPMILRKYKVYCLLLIISLVIVTFYLLKNLMGISMTKFGSFVPSREGMNLGLKQTA